MATATLRLSYLTVTTSTVSASNVAAQCLLGNAVRVYNYYYVHLIVFAVTVLISSYINTRSFPHYFMKVLDPLYIL